MTPEEHSIPVERELFLRSLGMAAVRGGGMAKQMVRAMRDVSFKAGEPIYRAGELTGQLHFIVRGQVELVAEGLPPWRFVAPAVVGIFDVLQQRPFTRTATAVTDVQALRIAEEDWFEVLEDHFDFAQGAMRRNAADVHRMHLELPPEGGFVAPPATAGGDGATALNLLERTLAIRAVPIFHASPVQALATLAGVAVEVPLEAGERLHRLGDAASGIHVVASGVVVAERRDLGIRARFGPGSIVGGGAAIGLTQHGYDADAESAALALRIGFDDLFDVIEDHVELIRAVLGGLAAEREILMDEKAARAKGAPISSLPRRA